MSEKTWVNGIIAAVFLIRNERGELAVAEIPALEPRSCGTFTAKIVEGKNVEFGFQEPDRLVGYDVAMSLSTPDDNPYGETILRLQHVAAGTTLTFIQPTEEKRTE